mgnify:CR=1 FL=1
MGRSGHASRPWATPNPVPTLAQVIDKIATMDEPRRSIVQRVHEVVLAAECLEPVTTGAGVRSHSRPDTQP